jgi:hypothetical protein
MPAIEPVQIDPWARVVAVTAAVALAVGSLGGAITICREYRNFLADRPDPGPLATVDFYLRSAEVGHAAEFMDGLERAGLPMDADVTYVAPVSGRSRLKFWQTYYVASYLLYPRQVWPIAWCDVPGARECEPFQAVNDLSAAIRDRGARHVLVAGQNLPINFVRAHPLSPSLTLLDLR